MKDHIEEFKKEFDIRDTTPEELLAEGRRIGIFLYSRKMLACLTGKSVQQINNEHEMRKIDVLGIYMKNRIRRYYLDSDYCVVKRSILERLLSNNS